ncbi:MAG: hypothetical protein JKY45_04350 [Emcibacter sp.]|nr:hypothetical protein [Emcibacter sp.]
MISLYFLGFFPVIFWGRLDAYFLSKERGFRALYDVVRQKSEVDIDFFMDVSEVKKEGLDWQDSFLLCFRTIHNFCNIIISRKEIR